jgi:hypothetical protein
MREQVGECPRCVRENIHQHSILNCLCFRSNCLPSLLTASCSICVPANISRLNTDRRNENAPIHKEIAVTLTAHFSSRTQSSLSSNVLVRDTRLTTEKAVKLAQSFRFMLSVIVNQRCCSVTVSFLKYLS